MGNTFEHDGVKLYYEVHGSGEPLLMIHGNGACIGELAAQIEFFRHRYQVIAMDSRDHGKSSDSLGPLTYEAMADDLAALLDHLHVPSAYVLGWSDGGIEALLLALRHPAKVNKIAAMAPNLNPAGLHPETIAHIQSSPPSKTSRLMLEEPHVEPVALKAIAAPVLLLAGDHDMIRDEHTIEIFHHLPNGQLCIFPGATHTVPFDDPALFNAAVERFFREPFVKKHRIRDAEKSFEAIRKSLA